MRKLMLLAGVAALSVSLPVVAKENQGRGKGGGQQAEQSHGGGQGNAQRGRGGNGAGAQADRDQGRDRGPNAESRGRGAERRLADRAQRQEARVERHAQREERKIERAAHGNARGGEQRATRDERRIERALRDESQTVRGARRAQQRDWSDWSERRLVVADRIGDDRLSRRHGRARAGFCPPGLARQNPYCMPPGQLRKAQLIGQRLSISNSGYNVPDRYSYRFVDNDDWFYRYDDQGYVYRFDRDNGLVNSIVPLFGSNLLMGQPLPLGYEVYNVPLSYRSYYPDGGDNMYRYDDGAIYQVNPENNLIEGIVALLTGGVGGLGGLGIGDSLPTGYDAYNVPLDYRDEYADSDDSWYRYADGSVYQVDPQTRLIEQVISLLV